MKMVAQQDTAKRFYCGGLMDLSDFHLEPANLDRRWDAFVDLSPDRSIFAHSTFLRNCGAKIDAYVCLKNRQVVAGVYLVVGPTRREAVLDKLVIYNGPVFSPPDPKQNQAQVNSDRFAASAFLVEALAKLYDRVALRPAPSVKDLRPFLWHNYGTDGPKFRATLRYTSILEISDIVESNAPQESGVYCGMSKSRRQEIRYAQRQGLVTSERYDRELFRRFYRGTFERQGIDPGTDEIERTAILADQLIAAGTGRAFLCGRKDSPAAIAIFGIVAGRGYYLYGATDPAARSGHAGTAVLWDAMRQLAYDGIRELDLEGVNSPARGYFKLSFGGNLVPYHALCLDKD